jgi:threonine dehydrogenase-like Zn-dependent dehydrogenase
MGAGRVIAVDRVPERLRFAREYNGVETLNFDEVDDPVLALREMTGGRGADVCIDAVGMEAGGTAIAWCIQTARKGGNVSIVGVYGPPWNLVPIGTAMNKGLTLADEPVQREALRAASPQAHPRGADRPRRIITHRFPLQRAPEAYHLFETRTRGCIKCVLVPQGEA